jgi:hypothetical protein
MSSIASLPFHLTSSSFPSKPYLIIESTTEILSEMLITQATILFHCQ